MIFSREKNFHILLYIWVLIWSWLHNCLFLYDFSGEKNFHIFYYLHDGLGAEDKEGRFHLGDHRKYK